MLNKKTCFLAIKSLKLFPQLHIFMCFLAVGRCFYICSLILCPHYNGIKALLAAWAHFLFPSSLLLLEGLMQLMEKRPVNGDNLGNVWSNMVPEVESFLPHCPMWQPRSAFMTITKIEFYVICLCQSS